MPAFSTHYIFAKEMMQSLKNIADFEINEDAVYIGTQGPDIFFFHRIMPWMIGRSLLRYATALHHSEPQILFENMRAYCSVSAKPDIAKSYAYGFILHYVLDRNCHPYVYALQNKTAKEDKSVNPHSVHNIIEFSMDAYLLNKRLSVQSPETFSTSSTINFNQEVLKEIGRLLEYVIPRTIGRKITAKQAEQAIKDTKYVQNLIFDPKGSKHKTVKILDTIIAPFTGNYKITAHMLPKDLEKAKKYANINNAKWKSPYSDDDRCESFENLFDISILDAQQIIKAFQAGKDCKEITENKSFLTGVEVK